MKKLNLCLLTLSLSVFHLLNGQQNQTVLNGNSVAATIEDDGTLFHKKGSSSSGYEVAAGSGNHLLYNGRFWFGGTNQNGELKLAANLYDNDFYRGPYSSTNAYYDTAYVYAYESGIWKVKKSEIIYHIDNYNQPGYVAPAGIAEWPGNGNPSIGVAAQLAPFVDLNNNGVYEPYEGDYPCIKGDEAVYQIIHEDRPHNNSGGDKVGAEVHIMLYHIASNDFVDSTTFIDMKVYNRGQNSFNDFKVAFYLDPDIGFSEDDYIGSAPAKNMIYAYNGPNFDSGQQDAPGYQSNPPAIGIVSLNRGTQYSGYFNRSDLGTPDNDDPSTPADYWNYMNGKWKNGADWVNGGTGFPGSSGSTLTPTQHIYDGNPYLGTGWTEHDIDGSGTSNTPGDRRFFMTTDDEVFQPGDVLTYSYAVIVNRQGNQLENVQGILDYADLVQNYYDNTVYSCNQVGTGISDDFDLTQENARLSFEITRLDGEGNMSRSVKINAQTEQNILDSTAVKRVGYQRGEGPIEAYLTDTITHATGHFILKFNNYVDIDTAHWTVYHYDTAGGVLIDSVNSNSAINVGNELDIPQWGMAIRIKQMDYFCSTGDQFCAERDKAAKPLEAKLSFEDENNSWLTGVKNANGMSPVNWIMSGSFDGSNNAIPGDSIHNPACYSSNYKDPNNLFTKLADGIVSPGNLARFGECDLTPVALASSVGSYSLLSSIVHLDLPTVYQPSIDIVFTNDKSKWTRSPVVELNKDELNSVNGAKAGFLRQSPSVDKEGNPDGTGTGMGWFPGYAIDVETGRRLNIVFGENSTMTDDNGADMIWNPSDRLMDNDGNYVLGGQHVIYVYGGENDGMPNYDEGAFIHQQLSLETIPGYRNVYSNLSWVVQPLLKQGEQLLSSDARLAVRINKEFKTNVLSNQNEGKPMFSWDVIPYDEVLSVGDVEIKQSDVKIYPNPATNQLNIVWDEIDVKEIKITSFQGKTVKSLSANGVKGDLKIDINDLSPGIYFVNVGNTVHKLIVK